MKIDIITRHAIPNYGSILQSYATQKAIEQLGHDSEIINYIKSDETNKNTVLTNCNIKGTGIKTKIKRILYYIVQSPNVSRMNRHFTKFREKYLKQTPIEYNSSEELKQKLPQADIYCTGSDQVWGKIGKDEYDKNYFLDFAPSNKKCITYAASFGVDKLPKDLDENLENLLKKYDDILVRENSAENIIKEKGLKNVKQVLDPTLLLDKEKWNNICEKTKLDGKKYILVYQLHHNKEMENYVKNLEKHTKLPIYRVHPSLFYMMKPGKYINMPTPGQFVSYIKNAEYIVTDSFHGTVFSLIFNKNFVDILPGKTSTRITSILQLVGLENRIVRDYNNYHWLEEKIDYRNANKILEQERQKSLNEFKSAIEKEEQNINLLNKRKQCTGCGCCMQICPKGAIYMSKNEEGFLEPKIDKTKCINCGLCLKRCPQINNIKTDVQKENDAIVEDNIKLDTEPVSNKNVKCYAARIKDDKTLSQSSSGGIFVAMANKILEENGIIAGATFKENLEVEHILIKEKQELQKLQGSKYVQSNTKDTFTQTKKALEEGKTVLYSGTPCQIAGLKQFLNKDYSNLYTTDIVCHGVPSPEIFAKHVKYLEEKNKSKVVEYSFRDKAKKGWGLNLKVKFENGKGYYKDPMLDSYYKAFLHGDIYRECCYECKYANTNRISDVTLADFWQIEKIAPEFYNKRGNSAVIVNTEKGQTLFDKIKENIEFKETKIELISQGNLNLKRPTKRPKIREHVYDGIDYKNYKQIEKKNLKFRIKLKDIIKSKIPQELKNKIKKIIKK